MKLITSGKKQALPQKRSIEEITYMAYMDQLTETYNRNMLEDLREQFDGQNCYVTIVDIDGLKLVNDRLGHQAGDIMIRRIANNLKDLGDYVFRLGGDEFLIIDYQQINYQYYLSNISCGTVQKGYNLPLSAAMQLADMRMYYMKKSKRKELINREYGIQNAQTRNSSE